MPAQAHRKGPAHHFLALDGLRGIAALLVLLCHCVEVWAPIGQMSPPVVWHREKFWNWLFYSPLHLFWDGEDAVVLFFVLSGFVLSLSFLDRKELSYPDYLVRRFFRLYPALVAAILCACAVILLVAPARHDELSPWLPGQALLPLTMETVIRHLLLLGDLQSQWLDVPIWSLVHEVRISIIFPFLMWILLRSQTGFIVLSAATFAGAIWVSHRVALGPVTYVVMRSFHYVIFFAWGAWLAHHRARLIPRLAALPVGARVLLVAAALLLFSARWSVPAGETAADVFAGLGGGLLILAALGFNRLGRRLETAPIQWLGRVSYSLYLLHIPVMALCIYALRGRVALIVPILLTIPAALAAADVMSRLVERPAMVLGRRLTRRAA